MKVSLREFAKKSGALVIFGNIAKDFTQVAIDSRKIQGGELFFALKGEQTDGHNYVETAAHLGAVGAVVENHVNVPPGNFVQLKVQDAKQALQECGRLARTNFEGIVVGVTGSNGKTTTKDMIANVLAQKFKTEKTFANYNNEIGLPLTIANCPDDKEALVLEMGMRARDEIAFLADIAKPHIGVITNVGVAHIEILKTQENIALAKFELISALPPNGTAVLNIDDEWCLRFASKACSTIFYGFHENADIRCTGFHLTAQGTSFTINYNDSDYEAFLPTWGRHNISNALAAVAVGVSAGLSPEIAISGLKNYQPSPMRLEVKTGKSGFCILDDAYNANPLSVAASLEVLRAVTDGRTIAVLGEMYELGDFEQEGHESVGRKVTENGIDVLVTVGKIASHIAKAASHNGMHTNNIYMFPDNEKASLFLLDFLQPQDTLLIKGSRGMRMENIVLALT